MIDKPPGLVVHPGAGHATGTLVDALGAKAGGGEPERRGIVHRLDRDTSGLMVVARNEEAHRRLSALVRQRALERTYLALVQGRPRSRTGRIEAPIGRDRGEPTRMSLDTRVAPGRRDELRGRPALAGLRAAARAARDGAHAPDPRAPGGDRPAGRRRRRVRRARARARAPVPARLRSSRSRTRSAASAIETASELAARASPRYLDALGAHEISMTQRPLPCRRARSFPPIRRDDRSGGGSLVRVSLHRGPPALPVQTVERGYVCPSSP